MNMTNKEYGQIVKNNSPPSPSFKNIPLAFLSGGLICVSGQYIQHLLLKAGQDITDARTIISVCLIALSGILTGIGVYDKIAKHAGAGTIVPITGFANSIVAPAIEFKSEGLILGMGAKMFVMAGPVLVFGITSSVIYGLILCLFR